MKRLSFHPAALDELDAAVAWHENERPGRGARLFDSVARRVLQAARFPNGGPPIAGFPDHNDVRQFVVKHAPYVLVTALIRGQRMVVAVAHTSRAPGYWRERLET